MFDCNMGNVNRLFDVFYKGTIINIILGKAVHVVAYEGDVNRLFSFWVK